MKTKCKNGNYMNVKCVRRPLFLSNIRLLFHHCNSLSDKKCVKHFPLKTHNFSFYISKKTPTDIKHIERLWTIKKTLFTTSNPSLLKRKNSPTFKGDLSLYL